jgi:hypothetical protein
MQKSSDLSRSLTPFGPDGTLIAVVEMSLMSWLVGAQNNWPSLWALYLSTGNWWRRDDSVTLRVVPSFRGAIPGLIPILQLNCLISSARETEEEDNGKALLVTTSVLRPARRPVR